MSKFLLKKKNKLMLWVNFNIMLHEFYGIIIIIMIKVYKIIQVL